MIGTQLSGLVSFFPWNLIIALFLAFVFAVVGIAIFRHTIAKSEEAPAQEKPSPFLEKWKMSFAQFGYFATTSSSKSFVQALNIMHSFIGGRNFRYQLPWIVMLGTKESGKSTLLQSLSLDKPIGQPLFSDEGGDKPLCDWRFYDHGVVLDLDGKIVLNPTHAISDEENWHLFLNLLTHHRAKRPLDGVVLTIPASEIIGQTALSHDDIMIRAEYLYGKLWNMQRVTGMRVPVYLVVTKCDLVPGFESVCKSIPTHNRSDIFGWSNDEAIDALYNPDWVDTAFASINSSLYRIQEEIYAQGKAIDNRNGVFMFPISFNTLKGGIRTYANHLFKESSYHESFFLRGIYFVGDSHLNGAHSLANSSAPPSLNLRNDAQPVRRNIYFADNLFENKIFREVGLARPISRVLLGNTRSMRFAKAAVALIVIVGTLGLLRAHDNLQKANLNLTPNLSKVEQTLAKIRNQSKTAAIARSVFEDQAKVVLDMMTKISTNHLSSVFIPASWFSSIDKKIKFVMGLAYDQVIIQAMAKELENRATLITDLHTQFHITEMPANGIDPLKTIEFYNLQYYVRAINDFENIANKFNAALPSIDDVVEIINYLFNINMPHAFYENDNYYIEAFTKPDIFVFKFKDYQDSAIIKLRKLFDAFQHASFSPHRMIPGLGKLESSIKNFSGAHNYAADDANVLRDIYLNLKETLQSIQNPGLNWLDESTFDPGHSYDVVKDIVSKSEFFNPIVATELITQTNNEFIRFRKALSDDHDDLLFSNESLFKNESGLAIASPSDAALTRLQTLESFFAEPFMKAAPDKSILTSVPLGTVLLWDTLRLQEASSLVKTYNNFINSHFLSLPKSLQPILQKIAREGLTRNLVSLITDAQVFNSDIVVESRLMPEEALLPQVQNYRAAAPYFEQLVFALKANNANTAFGALKSVLTEQTYSLVKKLDHILANEAPYAIKLNSFGWWRGKNLAALEAFSVSTLNQLSHYLTLQRDRINYLAREFAGPLVSFLEQINKEGMPGDLPLLSKWDGIIHELNEYDRKTPGNGLVELEDYIMNPLNEVTLATCSKFTNLGSMLSPAEDYFVSILVNIQEKLQERCVSLSGAVSVDYYEKLSQFFKTNLAGKFPFVEKVDNSTPDANPEDIRTFFEILDTQAAGLKATLKEATNLGAEGKKALIFIEQMEKVRQFFGGYLDPNSSFPTPSFSFDVAFRINKEKEVYANEILDWELTTQDTTITMRSPSPVGYWEAGNPMRITFRWALNSPLQPMLVEDLPNFDVQGENAIFSYDGIWPLLRLLKQHHASSSDFSSLNDDNPITLRFDIPLTNVLSQDSTACMNDARKATVFIRLKVSPIEMAPPKKAPLSPKEGAPPPAPPKIKMGAPVNLPYFPFHAPRLNLSGIIL